MTSPLTPEETQRLQATARRVREQILHIVYHAGSGHLGAALSQADLLVALYYRTLRVSPSAPEAEDRDRFVLSKGHGGLGLVPILADLGFINPDDVATFGKTGSALGMHMDHRRVPGVEASTGSLGHGLGVALGMALGARMKGLPSRTFCLLSDGECYEGSIWEAAIAAAAHKVGGLVVLLDRNHLTMDGFTEEQIPLEPLADKWRAFGWHVEECDGHDYDQVCAALDRAVEELARPSILVATTVKGKGVDFMEAQPKWHYGALDSDMYERALESVGR